MTTENCTPQPGDLLLPGNAVEYPDLQPGRFYFAGIRGFRFHLVTVGPGKTPNQHSNFKLAAV